MKGKGGSKKDAKKNIKAYKKAGKDVVKGKKKVVKKMKPYGK